MKKVEKPEKVSLTNVRKFFKIFVINNHSDHLKDFDGRLSKAAELGSCKKIVAVKVAQNNQTDDSSLASQIVKEIEKAKKKIEGAWKSLKGDLETDIWAQWLQSMEEQKLRRYSKKQVWIPKTADDFETELNGKEREIYTRHVIPRLISNSDMKVLYDELRYRDMVVPDYYIVVFCQTSTAVIKKLLEYNVASAAIIHFIPCPVKELESQFPELHNDIQEFKKSLETKEIGVFTSAINMESLIDPNPEEVYEQLKNYLFDIEMLSQHFLIYQNEFLEINDTLTSHGSLIRSFHKRTNVESSDNAAVCVYLDNLYRMVEMQTVNERRYSSFHPRPFLDNDFGKIIIEDANELLKSAISTQMNLVSYWKAIEMVINSIRQNPTITDCAVDNQQLPLYKELLSWESFAQRLEVVMGDYDHCCCKNLSDKFKMFIFRRTFNKILETTRKIHLPTRLCFRDFCSYIAPRYVDVLRRRSNSFSLIRQESDSGDDTSMDGTSKNDTSTNETFFLRSHTGHDVLAGHINFSGLTFDDTFQELTVVEKVYRFHRTGWIRVRMENWMYKETNFTVEINLFGCVIYAHRWSQQLPTLFPRVRLISRNGIACNVEMSEDPAQPYISIQWPNDCQIRYLMNGVGGLEQRYYWATTEEYKRVYTNRGSVLLYLRSGVINVLTPNGIIYQLYPEPPENPRASKTLASTNVSIELAFVESLRSYGIDCTYFDVTRNDGRKLRILNGVAIEERAQYLVYEWMDLGYGEMFAERDDGVKLISSFYGLKTYYPCGTMIHTVADVEYIEVDIVWRSQSTENILRKINPDILRRLKEKDAEREVWVTFNLTCQVLNERFASVTCYEQTKMIIESPGKVKVIVTEDSVGIDVGHNVSLRFTPDLCTITSSYDYDISIKLNLISNDDEMLCFQSADAKVTLKEDGRMIIDEGFIPLEPYDEELYFLTKEFKFGVAYIPKYEFDDIVRKYKTSPFFYETDNKVVILRNVLPINERFSMPIPDIETNLDKLFITKCRRKPREDYEEEHVLSARTIIKIKRIAKDLCDCVKWYSYIEMSLADNIQDAMDHWFGSKIPKRVYSPAWKKKIRDTAMEMKLNKSRAPVYHAMIQYKVFPKYHEYVEAGRDVDKLDLKKLMPMLAKKGFKKK